MDIILYLINLTRIHHFNYYTTYLIMEILFPEFSELRYVSFNVDHNNSVAVLIFLLIYSS